MQKLRTALSSNKRGPMVQTAIAINDDEFYRCKLQAYLNDLPSYQEHGQAVTEAQAALEGMKECKPETVAFVNDVFSKFPKWRDSLRPSSLSTLESLLLENVKQISQHVHLKDKELVTASQSCVAEACILFPMQADVQKCQENLATRVAEHEQTTQQEAVMSECQRLTSLPLPDVDGVTSIMKACLEAGSTLRPQLVQESFCQLATASLKKILETLSMVLQVEPQVEKKKGLEYVNLSGQWFQLLGGLLNKSFMKKMAECCALSGDILATLWKGAGAESTPVCPNKQQLLKFKQVLDESRKMAPGGDGVNSFDAFVAFHKQALAHQTKEAAEVKKKALADLEEKKKVVYEASHEIFDKWMTQSTMASFPDLLTAVDETVCTVDPDKVEGHCDELKQVCGKILPFQKASNGFQRKMGFPN